MTGMALVVSLAMLTISCQKDETNDNGNNNGNTENPGEGSGVGNYNNQEYPSTANVIRRALTDIDGNIYDAVQIGNQIWMAENLRTTKYADSTSIPLGNIYTGSGTAPYRYEPNNDNSNVSTYGYLYNWPAVMHGESSSETNPSGVQGICPTGWHVPSDAEWTQLTDYMKTQPAYMTSGNADHLAKALAATWGWNSSDEPDAPGNNLNTNNATGFSALPAGYSGGYYIGFGIGTSFQSATEIDNFSAYCRKLVYDGADVSRNNYIKSDAHSVRCIRD